MTLSWLFVNLDAKKSVVFIILKKYMAKVRVEIRPKCNLKISQSES